MNTKKTNFFIVGAPKCGTTSMYHWLKQHSQIYFPEVKEPHFFSTDLHPDKRAIKTPEEYAGLYTNATGKHKILGDASVFYLYSQDAVPNILKYNSEAKFLVMLRNPVDMVISLHAQYLYTGNEIYEDFEKAWRLKDKRVQGVGITKITEDPQLLNYGEVCKVGKQIERLLKIVNRENISFIFLDDLKKNSESQLYKVLDFLEIQKEKIDMTVKNKATKRRFSRLQRILKHVNMTKKKLNINRVNTGFGKLINRFNSIEVKKNKLNDSLMLELKDFFKTDIEQIEHILNTDLQDWHKR